MNETKLTILAGALLVLAACDKERAPSAAEEAGAVAIECIASMQACDDWTPIHMADKRQRVPTEDCSSDAHHDDGFECRQHNREIRRHNWEVDEAPVWRSPCQQRIDSCVSVIDALVGVPGTVHNHYEK